MNQKKFKGTITALATPFNETSEKIDYGSLENLINYQIKAGVDGLVICGSTAEAASMNDDEYLEVLKFSASKAKNKLQLIGGIITNNTARACEMALKIKDLGYDAVLVVAPPYIKPTQAGLIQHYSRVQQISGLPVIAYNIPGRSACTIQPQTIRELAEKNIIQAIKDSTGSLDLMLEVKEIVNDNFDILSGEDNLVHPIMACGGSGVISASANVIPKEFLKITNSALNSDWSNSLKSQLIIRSFVNAMFSETNPIPVKCALKLKGIIASDSVRVPLTIATHTTRERIKELLEKIK